MTGTFDALIGVHTRVVTPSMKNLLVISFVIIYTVFSAGVNVIIHTCGDESEALLATTSFEDPCGCSDEMTADRCCTTNLTTVKLDVAQQSVVPYSVEAPLSIGIYSQQSSQWPMIMFEGTEIRSFTPVTPPLHNLNILNSVFLI